MNRAKRTRLIVPCGATTESMERLIESAFHDLTEMYALDDQEFTVQVTITGPDGRGFEAHTPKVSRRAASYAVTAGYRFVDKVIAVHKDNE